jgi:hypothetical protein
VRPDGRTSNKYTAHRKDGCAIALARKELKGLTSLRLTLFSLRSVYTQQSHGEATVHSTTNGFAAICS